MLDNPSVFVTIAADIELLESLERCDSLRQVQIKLHNHLLGNEVKVFFNRLEECEELGDVQRILNQQAIKSIVLPPTFDRWLAQMKIPRFKRDLTELYYCSVNKRRFAEEDDASEDVVEFLEERKEMIEQAASTVIAKHIEICKTSDLLSIKTYFRQKLHIEIDQVRLDQEQQEAIPFPPLSKDDWETCHASADFCNALAEQWVDYQTKLSERAYQRMRQAVLAKIQVEDNFLHFRLTLNKMSILSSGAQLFMCWPQTALKTAAAVLELFVTKFAKLDNPGAGTFNILYPLYPDFNFKLEGFIILLAEHFFAIKYKPNEYSREGYQVNMHMRYYELATLIHYFITVFKELKLWLSIRLIENCIIGLKYTPFEKNARYQTLKATHQEEYLDFENKIRKTKERLKDLRIKDAKLAIAPDHACDPLQEIAQDLQEADLDYCHPELIRFFQNSFGLNLKQTKKEDLQKTLEDFFARSEESWTALYQDNRFSYLSAARTA